MQILLIEDSVTDGSSYISFGCENVNSTLKHLKVTKIQMLLENLTKKKSSVNMVQTDVQIRHNMQVGLCNIAAVSQRKEKLLALRSFRATSGEERRRIAPGEWCWLQLCSC